MILELAAVAAGLVLLAWAADQFVVGAARLARTLRVAPVVVGVVVLGFGTSSPELLVSVLAALGGQIDVAVGNVVGSNLANLSLLLGVGVLISPLAVASGIVRREAPLALLASAAVAGAVQGEASRWEGAALLVAMAAVVWVLLRSARQGTADPLGGEVDELVAAEHPRPRREVVRSLAGLVGTLAGAQLLLWGATALAGRSGLSEGFVGVTLVAVGTSLPELVTVVQSARRRETDLVLGNLLGSNIFNSLFVAGGALAVGPGRVTDTGLTVVAVVAMLAVTALVWLFLRTGHRVRRGEGAALVALYAALVPLLA